MVLLQQCWVLQFPHEIPIKGCVRLGFFITFSLPLCFHLCSNYFGQLLTENIKLYSSPDLTRSCRSFARSQHLFAKKSDNKDHEIWYLYFSRNLHIFVKKDHEILYFHFATNQHLFAKKSDSKDHEIWYFAYGKSEAEVEIPFGDPHSIKTDELK